MLLEGRSETVVKRLQQKMETAAEDRQYETAGQYRDQIAAISQLQSKQAIAGGLKTQADAVAVVEQGGQFAVACIMIRAGRVLGSRKFYPKTAAGTTAEEVMAGFLGQHYFSHEVPREILLNVAIDDTELLAEGLTEQAGHKVELKHRLRERRKAWVEMARQNASEGLGMRLASNASLRSQREELADLLELDESPLRIECFDISHTGGEKTVASCVVFGEEGPVKQAYRRFNIKDVEKGDDYAAIEQVVMRRYKRLKSGEAPMPDLILIDGGKGQLGKAREALEELQLTDLTLAAVSKGPDRRPGDEQLWVPGRATPLRFDGKSGALHLIQQARDEAHRFAIAGHRAARGKARQVSPLEAIPGLGPKRRKQLLTHFGGLQGVMRAGKEDLTAVQGISKALAETIYGHLHGVKDAERK